MKKRLIRLVSAGLCSVMIFTLAACGNSSSNNGTGSTSTNTTSSGETAGGAAGDTAANDGSADWTSLKKYDPMISITISASISPDELRKHDGSMSLTGNWGDWARDTLGINYEYKWVATDGDDAAQKLQIGIASGDMPDIISSIQPNMVQQLASTDQIWCLEDLINQYGSPLTKYIYETYDEQAMGQGFAPVSYNGKYYAGPVIFDTVQQASASQWIRKDIVDELGLPMPSTITDFENVMAAYKAKHPSGIGYLYSLSFSDQMNAAEPIFSPFNAHPQHWIEKDGQVVYGSVQPEVKEGLLMLQDWYAKGYIDLDFASKDFWAQSSSFINGDVLMMMTPFWGYGWALPILNRAIPTSEVVPMPLLKGRNGEENSGMYLSFSTPWPTVITKACKNPEALVFELNMALDSYFRNDDELRAKFDFYYPKTEVKQPLNPDVIAAEGIDEARYDYAANEVGPSFFDKGNQQSGGKALISDKSKANILIDTSLRIYDALNNGTFDQLSYDDQMYYNTSIMTRENMQQNEMAARAHFLNCLQMNDDFSNGRMKYDAFLGAPTENMINKNAYLTKIELQCFADIITGKAGIESFDAFVADWHKNGGDIVTQEVNEWYQQNK